MDEEDKDELRKFKTRPEVKKAKDMPDSKNTKGSMDPEEKDIEEDVDPSENYPDYVLPL